MIRLSAVGLPWLAAGMLAIAAPVMAAEPSPGVHLVDGEPLIVYVGPVPEAGGVGLRLIRPDGTGERWAAPGAPVGVGGAVGDGWQLYPDWSPDGDRIAFVVDTWPDPEPTRDLWVTDADGTDARLVHDCVAPCWVASYPAWSNDGLGLLFTRWDHDARGSDGSLLQRLDLATGAVTTVAATTGPEYLLFPRWSPDERAVVAQLDSFTDISDAATLVSSAIVIVDLATSPATIRPLTGDGIRTEHPDWHPARDLIVYSARPADDPAAPAALFTIRSDGSEPSLLASDGWSLAQPTWLPDGSGVIAMRLEDDDIDSATMVIVDLQGVITSANDRFRFGTHPRMRPGP